MTQEKLKQYIEYNKETGKCINKITRGGLKIGARCGNVHTITKYNYTYRQINIAGKQYKEHRIIWLYMTGSFPKEGLEIDHKNGTPTDNIWENLQLLTHKENIKKAKISKNNTSGHIGVTFDKHRNKWIAQIMIDGKTKYLGRYCNIDDAVKARKTFTTSSSYQYSSVV